MALIPCPECNNQVSTAAAACPKCGFPIGSAKPNTHTSPMQNCPDCGGQGQTRRKCQFCYGTGNVICETCNGNGYTYDPSADEKSVCWDCHGNPRYGCPYCPIVCESCSGSGQITSAQYDAIIQKRTEDKRQEELRTAALEIQRQEEDARRREADRQKREEEEIRKKAEAERIWLTEKTRNKAGWNPFARKQPGKSYGTAYDEVTATATEVLTSFAKQQFAGKELEWFPEPAVREVTDGATWGYTVKNTPYKVWFQIIGNIESSRCEFVAYVRDGSQGRGRLGTNRSGFTAHELTASLKVAWKRVHTPPS